MHRVSDYPWQVLICEPNSAGKGKPKELLVAKVPLASTDDWKSEILIEKYRVQIVLENKQGYQSLAVKVFSSTLETKNCFVILRTSYKDQEPYNFDGPVKHDEIYRQSPHDLDAWIVTEIAMQGVPLAALYKDDVFHVAVSGSPALYQNSCSQAFDLTDKQLSICSGDNGQSPGLRLSGTTNAGENYNKDAGQIFSPGKIIECYHACDSQNAHNFEVILFNLEGNKLSILRRGVNQYVARHFSHNPNVGQFGALAFTTAWMNLRKNESLKSDYWVVPAVEYANAQYNRDAFWISMMLDPKMDAQALTSELAVLNHYAEYPLLAIIWAFRNQRMGCAQEPSRVQAYLDLVTEHVIDGEYHSYTSGDGRFDFQYWADLIAFEPDDVVVYNQGLLALALMTAKEMGLRLMVDPALARQRYQELYNAAGYFPISKKKSHLVGPDPLVGDLLAQLLFGKSLLKKEQVNSHFDLLNKVALTSYGYRNVTRIDGSFATSADYDIPGYVAQANRSQHQDGAYVRGGSWFLYDNIFLLDACLHGIPSAAQLLVWRIKIELDQYGTTFEYLNTLTGEPHKANMGWNIAIYALIRYFVAEGRLSRSLLDQIEK